jgi:hypothetical protein
MYLPRIVTPDPSVPFMIAPVPIRLSLAIMFYAQSTIGITKRVAANSCCRETAEAARAWGIDAL